MSLFFSPTYQSPSRNINWHYCHQKSCPHGTGHSSWLGIVGYNVFIYVTNLDRYLSLFDMELGFIMSLGAFSISKIIRIGNKLKAGTEFIYAGYSKATQLQLLVHKGYVKVKGMKILLYRSLSIESKRLRTGWERAHHQASRAPPPPKNVSLSRDVPLDTLINTT